MPAARGLLLLSLPAATLFGFRGRLREEGAAGTDGASELRVAGVGLGLVLALAAAAPGGGPPSFPSSSKCGGRGGAATLLALLGLD